MVCCLKNGGDTAQKGANAVVGTIKMKCVSKNRDMYVTGGRVHRRSDKVRSRGVGDGSTVHVSTRMLGARQWSSDSWV